MRVTVDWDGDGTRVAEFTVVRGALVTLAHGSHVPFHVTCPHGVVETVHYHPTFAEREDVYTHAAIDGACTRCDGGEP